MPLAISADKILDWNDTTAQRWRAFFAANPGALEVPSDIRNSKTVADTMQHIFAVELRYAQRLAALPESPYEAVPTAPLDALFAVHDQALAMVRALLADPAYDWGKRITFDTITAGRLSASREAVLLHLNLHAIRHYAQLATLVRQHGYKPDWPMDYLYTDCERA